MPKLNLTQAAADRLPTPADKHVTYWDTGLAGFGVRVSPKGKKTWVAQYRVTGGSEKIESLGTVALLPKLADAREKARYSMLQAKAGIDPVAERKHKQAAAKQAAEAEALTFGRLAERYVTEYAKLKRKPGTIAETDRLFTRAARFFGDKAVQAITKADVLDLISQPPVNTQPNVIRAGGLREATNLLKAVQRLLRWAVEHDLITSDPSAGVKKPLKGTSGRERVLDDDEIFGFWQGCDKAGYPFGPLFKLLLLTGQRWSEVAELSWSELDLQNRVWHLPGERAKNSRAHDIHLSEPVMAIIASLPRIASPSGDAKWLFTADGEHPVSGYWPAKLKVVATMGVSDWQIHDLRRTATTLMARLKVPPHVADKVLNHTQGTIKGVAAVYNRFEYRDERVAALDVLGQFVMALVDPETAAGKVVALRR